MMAFMRSARYTLFFLFVWILSSYCGAKGRIEFRTMPCKMLQGISEREYTVYLPDGYDDSPNTYYPVCYLLHGGNCSNTDWETFGRLSAVSDSLIEAGVMERMIVVCAEGNKNNMIWFNAPHWKYEDFFFEEFIPYIESSFRVKKGKQYRSVAGYSMGGGASVVYGLRHPDMFSVVYAMSAYLRRQTLDFLKNDPTAEWRQQIVEDHNPMVTIRNSDAARQSAWRQVDWFIDCGDKDFTFDANIDLVQALREKEIPYQLRIYGGGHDWDYWRSSLCRALIYISQRMK